MKETESKGKGEFGKQRSDYHKKISFVHLKEQFKQKMKKNLSSFTHPHVVPNLWNTTFHTFIEVKKTIKALVHYIPSFLKSYHSFVHKADRAIVWKLTTEALIYAYVYSSYVSYKQLRDTKKQWFWDVKSSRISCAQTLKLKYGASRPKFNSFFFPQILIFQLHHNMQDTMEPI